MTEQPPPRRKARSIWLPSDLPGDRRRSRTLLPLRDSLLVDPIAPRKRCQALLTILYCSTDCLRRSGAAM
jgi:hypothetical protein